MSADRSQHVWKSVAVTNFAPGAGNPALDKRSSKSDQFTITVDPKSPNKYTIVGKYDDEVQISLTYEQLAQGWKVGAGPRGGMTYFGSLKAPKAGKENDNTPDVSAGGDGYCIHRFWPRCAVGGIVRIGGNVVDMDGSRGTFIHAIQGMRPNVLAAKWNFANFQSSADDGVSLVMMEFTTTPAYGAKKVNIGSIVVDDKLVAVTAGGEGVVGKSVAEHQNSVKDAETGYAAPGTILYQWEGASIDKSVAGPNKAQLKLDLLEAGGEAEYKTKGLVEKVDVLGQIPYLVKKFVNYAAGTKPFIYTVSCGPLVGHAWIPVADNCTYASKWLNPATASVTTGGETKEVSGYIFNEATYIS